MPQLEDLYLKAGKKMTAQRRVIFQVLDEAEDHPSADMVYERARKIDASVSIATVYRTLSLLDELGLVVRHDFNETHSRYEVNSSHHHHLIDVDTGVVLEFESDEMQAIKKRIAAELGYDLVACRLELYGRKVSVK
jgi:Fur family ferric uptake transcriptional regulator